MIVADTMLWADLFGRGNVELTSLLIERTVVLHPYVRGEISLGKLPRRSAVLRDLDLVRSAPVAEHNEVLGLIESASLHGSGIGYVDAHLIASAMLLPAGTLWTRDRRLRAVAERLGIAFA